MPSEAFNTAVADSKKLTAKPSNEELLDLYGTSLSLSTQHPTSQTRVYTMPSDRICNFHYPFNVQKSFLLTFTFPNYSSLQGRQRRGL